MSTPTIEEIVREFRMALARRGSASMRTLGIFCFVCFWFLFVSLPSHFFFS